jgi:maltose O-acetyltransferase
MNLEASRLARLWREETASLHPRLQLARLLLGLLPPYTGARVRPAVLRAAGFAIGRGTIMMGLPAFTGSGPISTRLRVGEAVWFNIGVLINLGADVQIGDRAALGHEVMILTDSHALGPASRRAGELYARPVGIGAGAWIGARAILLPGVTIGDGAVVAAGAVVTHDVPPNVLVSGVPARVTKELGA